MTRTRASRGLALLTVPHAAPGNDAIAAEVALTAREVAEASGLDIGLLASVCCRYAVEDMNRPQARASRFRAAIRGRIEQSPPVVLVDVHSFPGSYGPYAGRDVVLLHTPGVTDAAALVRYALSLDLAARRLGRPLRVEVQRQHQDVVHDILVEARELGLPAASLVLAEHNEDCDPKLHGLMHAAAIRSLIMRGDAR